ncbi:MAG: phosphotransferase [Actinobacteria bacterium]|nr:phosphotransferase [Actinomycetota bacterium]
MAKKHHIPQTAGELTPSWFSSTLGTLGSTYGRSITAVETEVIGEGIGFIGELHRCTLTWDDDPDPGSNRTPVPPSVVVKLPAPSGTNRSSGEALLAYDREIFIYKHMRDQMGIPMPKYYWSDQDKLTTLWAFKPLMFLIDHLPIRAVNWLVLRFVKLSGKNQRRYLLMMEDIADARPPSQVEGGTLDDAFAALEVLAKFHAHHWSHQANDRDAGGSLSTLLDESPLIFPVDQGPKTWQAGYLRNREDFVERFGDALGAEKLAKLDEVQEGLVDLIKSLGAEPRTLIHADYRLDNILYRPNGELVVLDFQLVAKGRAGWDVGYFITTALTPDLKSEEDALLRRYHDSLVAAGVTNYSWEVLTADIATTKLVLAHRMVGARDLLDSDMEGSDESFADILVERIVGWID